MIKTYSYIVEFNDGTYCSQVKSLDLNSSLAEWCKEITRQKNEIDGLTDSVLNEIMNSFNSDDEPTPLHGLKNFWHHLILTSAGTFFINIVQTDLS